MRRAQSAVARGNGGVARDASGKEAKVAQNGKKPRQISAEDKVMMLS
jgi:hypothetical protein